MHHIAPLWFLLLFRSVVWSLQPTSQENQNTREYLDQTRTQILESLQSLPGAPSIQLQEAPPDAAFFLKDEVRKGGAGEGLVGFPKCFVFWIYSKRGAPLTVLSTDTAYAPLI